MIDTVATLIRKNAERVGEEIAVAVAASPEAADDLLEHLERLWSRDDARGTPAYAPLAAALAALEWPVLEQLYYRARLTARYAACRCIAFHCRAPHQWSRLPDLADRARSTT